MTFFPHILYGMISLSVLGTPPNPIPDLPAPVTEVPRMPIPGQGTDVVPQVSPSLQGESTQQTQWQTPNAVDPLGGAGVQQWRPEVWGLIGLRGFYAGTRMAPNGVPFGPLFDFDGEINIGLLPNKKLYLFGNTDFWGQKAGANVTNPTQGSFDFSKREWDFTVGVAYNVYGPIELRAFGYAFNNLNRGTSTASPSGYNNGVGLEARWYLATTPDPYDTGKLSFLSIGYLPSNRLTGLDGLMFRPGLTARAYLIWDLPSIRSYLFFDGQFEAETAFTPRLLLYDAGLAVRPWEGFQNLEFRIGVSGTYDVQVPKDLSLGYLGVRLQF